MDKNYFKAVGVIVVMTLLVGAYYFPRVNNVQIATTSQPGTSFSSAKYAGVTIDLSLNTGATSTSILNTDSNDRYVISTETVCRNMGSSYTAVTGAGLASLQLTVGTSSAASPAAVASVGAHSRVTSAFVFSTTTAPIGFMASSTLQTATSTFAARWKAGDYMTFWWNATNTPASGLTSVPCTEGVRYIGS